MAITNYTTLLARVQAHIPRATGTQFAAAFPHFVELAEDRIYNGSGEAGRDSIEIPALRSMALEHETDLEVTDCTAQVPADFLDYRSVTVDRYGDGLTYESPERFTVRERGGRGDQPVGYFTVHAGQIMLSIGPPSIKLRYYRRLPAIPPNNQASPLLEAHGLVVFDAVCAEALVWMQHAEGASHYFGSVAGRIRGANATAENRRHPHQAQIIIGDHIG